MTDTSAIAEHMEVRSSDDHHVGRVDHVMGPQIELAKLDLSTKFKGRLIPTAWVDHVDKHVHLNVTKDYVEANWTDKD